MSSPNPKIMLKMNISNKNAPVMSNFIKRAIQRKLKHNDISEDGMNFNSAYVFKSIDLNSHNLNINMPNERKHENSDCKIRSYSQLKDEQLSISIIPEIEPKQNKLTNIIETPDSLETSFDHNLRKSKSLNQIHVDLKNFQKFIIEENEIMDHGKEDNDTLDLKSNDQANDSIFSVACKLLDNIDEKSLVNISKINHPSQIIINICIPFM